MMEEIHRKERDNMKKYIAILCAALMLLGLTACGESGSGYTVGICQEAGSASLDAATQGFMDALKEELGDRVSFVQKNAEGDAAQCEKIVSGFDNADLILANGPLALSAAADASVPVLGTCVADYSAAPNASGTTDLVPTIDQAVMVAEWFMDKTEIGMVYRATDPDSVFQAAGVEKFLEDAGINCEHYTFTGEGDLTAAVEAACAASQLIYVPVDYMISDSAALIDGICRPAGIPVIGGDEAACKVCSVAAMAVDYYDLGVQTGKMAAKVLKGEAAVSDLAVSDVGFSQICNESIATALGISAPSGYKNVG